MTFFFYCKLPAQYIPYFQNFSLSEYKAGNQNWSLSRSEDGMLYVANNNGLLTYDGVKWAFNALPNKTIVRSVLAHNGLVYTGSYEEFGYWEKDSKGFLIYNSLSDLIKEQISSNEEIWQIVPFENGIIFRSFSNIYVYNFNGEIEKIPTNLVIISCNIVGDKLYVATLNNGIYELKNNRLVQIINNRALANTKVLAIKEFDGKLLIVTSLKGCFVYDGDTFKPNDFEVNAKIKQHLLNGFSILKSGEMAFGTIKDGVYITGSKGEITYHINKENGLINNTVLSQFLDNENNLWLGLDNGIAKVYLNNDNYFFNDVSGRLGAVYDVINYQGTVYMGSNTGLFYIDEQKKLQFIEGSQGQVWSLQEIEGDLFCGHNDGTFLVENRKLKLVSNVVGGWAIKKVPNKNNVYVQGTYIGLVTYKKKNGNWEATSLGKTTIPSKYLAFEDEQTAWVAHAYKGLYKVKFDKNYDSIKSIENYKGKGVFSDFNVRLYKIKNEICFKTNDGWLKYQPILDSIVPYQLLDKTFGSDAYIISEENTKQIGLKKANDVINFKSLNTDEQETSLSNIFLENKLIVGYENVSKMNDSILALNLDNGFMLFNTNSHSKAVLYKPIIDQIVIDEKLKDTTDFDKIDLQINSSFRISVLSPRSTNHFFEYNILELEANKWQKLEENTLELSSLKDGSYTILFRTSNPLGQFSEATKIQLEVLPPWYKSTLGFLLYTILFIIVVLLIYYFNKKKNEQVQKQLKIKYAKEQEKLLKEKTLENEKRIIQLKNESLTNEVKLKSKELANTAMALVKKNETLQEIKKELAVSKENFDNQYTYKKILKKVDNSIEYKDEWKVFEHNFNQVHEDFFKSLKSNHPNLTAKDLKICAYIKMNLANKEIAPLMNVSVRGLETHRYRLKKKLNLENDISVFDYLSNM
ncbi:MULTISPECIES: LuxR C-terminal-related transcriptional regulator [Cellulophaga]|uniref:LuxR C-terminal-related transcriptional regulator n=1 Tax=Cellulophaga TaxID=104264 RepID=UPI00209186C6|nr:MULTISPECIES: LuxR C-terminal-related transcriptional regulator [Cellulophaga]MDO6769235.1 LuxR C-terminal-related transcriptional regulator [Cellulophaga sp. 1_MG-2023]